MQHPRSPPLPLPVTTMIIMEHDARVIHQTHIYILQYVQYSPDRQYNVRKWGHDPDAQDCMY